MSDIHTSNRENFGITSHFGNSACRKYMFTKLVYRVFFWSCQSLNLNNFVIFCNSGDLKIVIKSLLWEVFEYLKIRNENWMKTAIICSSVQIWFSKFFYLLQFTEPRCLQSLGIILGCKKPRPKSTGFSLLGNTWKVCLWFKT